jgi:hypothetical protein
MLANMDLLSWYRRLFFRPPQSEPKLPPAPAEDGDADAQFALGLKYSTAGGVSQDLLQAAEWYRKAADQHHALAQFNLGLMFASGQGVPLDDAKALVWIRKAAEGGDAGAQHVLGNRYHRSTMGRIQIDSVESRVEAYKWFSLAAAQGYKGSDAARERMALGMTREEVDEGNQRAAMFTAGTPGVVRNQ